MTEGNIGIDISKSYLDAHRLEDETAQRFENTSRGFRALSKWLGATPVARVVYEPTGPYHRAFDSALSGTRCARPGPDGGGPGPGAGCANLGEAP